MRVLVTGGAGFIGSHLTDAFLARGDEVIVVDDLSAGRPGRIGDHAILHKLSIADAPLLTAIVKQARPELICHLAAQIDVRVSVDAPAQDAQVNVVGTVKVLEAARSWARARCSPPPGVPSTGGTPPSRPPRTCCPCPNRRTASPSTALSNI
jgi:UDP-glucose 4-epimerase